MARSKSTTTRRGYKAGESTRKAKALGFASYSDYLKSDHWQRFKRDCRRSFRPFRCAICHGFQHGGGMVLHHKTYERLGSEQLTDVVLLCARCHDFLHIVHRENDIPLESFLQAATRVAKAVETDSGALSRKRQQAIERANRDRKLKAKAKRRAQTLAKERRKRQRQIKGLKRPRKGTVQTLCKKPTSDPHPQFATPSHDTVKVVSALMRQGKQADEIAAICFLEIVEVHRAVDWIYSNGLLLPGWSSIPLSRIRRSH
jgi:shikimate kinase